MLFSFFENSATESLIMFGDDDLTTYSGAQVQHVMN